MRFKLILFVFACFIGSTRAIVEKACDQDLGVGLKRDVFNNQALVAKLHVISQLKLASRLSKDSFQRSVVKEKIDKLQASIEGEAAENLKKNALKSFFKNGKDQTYQKAVLFSERQNVKLPPAVAALLIKKVEESDCTLRDDCLEEEDLAILWLGKKLGLSSEKSNLVKSLNNQKSPKVYLKGAQGEKAFGNLIKGHEKNAIAAISQFQVDEQLCGGIFNKITCSRKPSGIKAFEGASDFTNITTLSKSQALEGKDSGELFSSVRSYYLDGAGNKVSRAPANLYEYTNRVCAGVEFDPKLRNKEVFGLSDSRGSLGGTKDAFSAYSKNGLEGLKSLNASTSTGGKFKGLKLLNALKIPGPMFRCEPESPIVVPKVGKLKADRNVCCDESVKKGKVSYYFFSWGGGMNCRAFFGLPYLAEVGAKIGAGFNVTLAGGSEPETCEEVQCAQTSPMINVSAGLYAEALVGAGSIQGTISWVPYMAFKQCVDTFSSKLPPADFSYQVGRVLAIVNVRLGWAFSYNEVKVIYEDQDTKHTSVPLF